MLAKVASEQHQQESKIAREQEQKNSSEGVFEPMIQCKYEDGTVKVIFCAPSGASTLELVAWVCVSGQRSNKAR